MLLRPMDGEVGHRLALAVELRPDAGVVGVQAARVEARIVAADEVEELFQLLGLEAVVDLSIHSMSGPNLQRPPMSTVACSPSQAPSGMG